LAASSGYTTSQEWSAMTKPWADASYGAEQDKFYLMSFLNIDYSFLRHGDAKMEIRENTAKPLPYRRLQDALDGFHPRPDWVMVEL